MNTIDATALNALLPEATVVNVGGGQGSQEIRGAIRYRPDDLLAVEHLVLPLPSDLPVVLYDERGDGKNLGAVAEKFASSGWSDVRVLDGGFAAWKSADLPQQDATMAQTVPPTRSGEETKVDHRL